MDIISQRDQSPELYRPLYDLLLSEETPDQALEQAVVRQQELAEVVAPYADLSYTPSPTELERVMATYNNTYERFSRISTFANMGYHLKMTHEPMKNLRQAVIAAENKLAETWATFLVWWGQQSEEQIEPLLIGLEREEYRNYLVAMQRYNPYLLPAEEEKKLRTELRQATEKVHTSYDELIAKLPLVWQGKEITPAAIEKLRSDPNRETRQAAHAHCAVVYGQVADQYGELYQEKVLLLHEEATKRGYPDAMTMKTNDLYLPPAATQAMLAACYNQAPRFHRYFALKGRDLGVPEMQRYDVHARMPGLPQNIPFEVAMEHMQQAFNRFSPEMGASVQLALDSGHIFYADDKAKGGEKIFYGVPGVPPFIALKYLKTWDNMRVMGHELGHHYHQWLAGGPADNRNAMITYYPHPPAAETASVFGELLLVDYAQTAFGQPDMVKPVLHAHILRLHNLIIRQAVGIRFEQQAHQTILAGKPMSEVYGLYVTAMRDQYGPFVKVPDSCAWEMINWTHLLKSSLTNTIYAMGALAALVFYQQWQQDPVGFVPKYNKVMAAGSRLSPADLFALADLDINQEETWTQGFQIIDQLINNLEE